MRIETVSAQDKSQLPGICLAVQDLADSEHSRKIKDGGDTRIQSIELFSTALKERGDRGVAVEDLADVRNVGIDLPQVMVPFRPKSPRRVRESVQPETIQS